MGRATGEVRGASVLFVVLVVMMRVVVMRVVVTIVRVRDVEQFSTSPADGPCHHGALVLLPRAYDGSRAGKANYDQGRRGKGQKVAMRLRCVVTRLDSASHHQPVTTTSQSPQEQVLP